MRPPQNRKCSVCGLVHFATDTQCRRCRASLAPDPEPPSAGPAAPSVPRRILGVIVLVILLLGLGYSSLLATSDGLVGDQERLVNEAIDVIERTGFTTDAAALRGVVAFRSTDSWWNQYVGHSRAYASTNFPFAVITLYPPFFDIASDETERAMILLHEAHHVFGAGEEAALREVWLEKEQLGWTSDRYEGTRVWKNTREWTSKSAPDLFEEGR